jgi:hypothetical protein
MRAKELTIVFFALMLSIAAFASEKQQRIELRVDASQGQDGAIQSFRFDSEEAGFDLAELQLGESRSYVDAEGNNLFVVRTEAGFDFDLNGRKISLPDITSEDLHMMVVHDGDESHGQKHAVRKVKIIKMESGEDINEYSDDVKIHEAHEIHIVRKEVDVTN